MSSKVVAEHLAVVGIPFSEEHRKRVEPYFTSVSHFPKPDQLDPVDREALASADVVYGTAHWIKSFDEISKARFVQLSNAGADDVLVNGFWKEDGRASRTPMATVAGIHMEPISQYFIMAVLSLFHRLQEQILIGQTEKRWGTADEVGGSRMFVQELKGKTVGILGYGHIGRECARLATAFGASVIAANSNGKKKAQDGYHEPHTGDLDGSLPEAWYSSRDPASLADFLSKVDVLLLALPSTANTKHVINKSTLQHLHKNAIIINIGRGDAIHTDALLEALDAKAIGGAALDVTDPEPLPAGHPLFGRRDVLLTPHLSGRTVLYWERALNIFETNLKQWKAGEEIWNQVDYEKGY